MLKNIAHTLLLLLTLCVLDTRAQRHKIDSLIRKLRTELHDTDRVKTLEKLAYKFQYVSPDTSIILSTQGLELTGKLEVPQPVKDRLSAGLLSNLGISNAMTGNYPEGLAFFSRSLALEEKLGRKSEMAGVLSNIGNIHSIRGEYSQALDKYYKALKIHETLKSENLMANCLQNMGVVYYQQKEYDKSLDHFYRALKVAEGLDNKRGLSSIVDNIGNVYQTQAELPNTTFKEKRELFNRALKMHLRSLDIAKDLGEKVDYASCLGNIANLYRNMEDYPKAFTNYNKAIQWAEEVGDKQTMATFIGNLGALYTVTKDYKKAETTLLKALEIAKEIGVKEDQMKLHNYLQDLYTRTGKYQLALKHYKEFISTRDSVFSEDEKKKSIQAELDFEYAKKEAVAKEKAVAAALVATTENRRQRNVILSVACILILTLVFAFFLYNRFKLTQKQKYIIEEQKHLVEEKHKEITDSINYAERIQRSLLASDELLKTNLKDHFVLFQPKDVVSGDFYWAKNLSDGRFAVLTADSTGHGVPGAIMSILNVSCLEKAVEAERLLEPGHILDHTRTKVIETLKKDGSKHGGKDGMDCSLMSLDLKNNTLSYAAANNPIWIIREKQLLEFFPDKMPVGKHDNDSQPFKQHTIDLRSGDSVYAFTDGIADQFGGPKGKKFMYKKLKELLISLSDLPMDQQKEHLHKDLNEWKGSLEQVDDICMVGIRI
jgi:serine phosphatase RsbU (regulator of sigma subunit)/Tfp pilus assembly protein PilF